MRNKKGLSTQSFLSTNQKLSLFNHKEQLKNKNNHNPNDFSLKNNDSSIDRFYLYYDCI